MSKKNKLSLASTPIQDLGAGGGGGECAGVCVCGGGVAFLTLYHQSKGEVVCLMYVCTSASADMSICARVVYMSVWVFSLSLSLSDYNHNGWLGVKHQVTPSLCVCTVPCPYVCVCARARWETRATAAVLMMCTHLKL